MLRSTPSSTRLAIAVLKRMFPQGIENHRRLGRVLVPMREMQARDKGIV